MLYGHKCLPWGTMRVNLTSNEEGAMLICPKCDNRCDYDNDGTCDSCGGSLAPAEASRKYVRTEKQDLQPYAVKHKVPNTRLRVALLGSVAVLAAAWFLILPAFNKGENVNPMDATVVQVANLQTSGNLTPESLAAAEDNSRIASECGWVHVFVVPTSAVAAPAPSGGIGGSVGQTTDPADLVVQYISLTFKPDEVSVTTADQGQTIVAAAAWACPS